MPRMLIRLAVALICALWAIPAAAAPSDAFPFKYLAFLRGACTTAQKDGHDVFAGCRQWRATHTFYQSNAVAFAFVCDAGSVSFLGWTGTRQSPEKYVLQVSTITRSVGGSPASVPGTGTCTIEGDIAEEATVTCDAATSGATEHYLFVFKNKGGAGILYGVGFEPTDVKANARAAIDLFDATYAASGLEGVRRHVEACYPRAQKSRWLPAVIACAVTDYAAALVNLLDVGRANRPPDPFFMERVTDLRAKEQFAIYAGKNARNIRMMEEIVPTLKELATQTYISFSKARTTPYVQAAKPEKQAAPPPPVSGEGRWLPGPGEKRDRIRDMVAKQVSDLAEGKHYFDASDAGAYADGLMASLDRNGGQGVIIAHDGHRHSKFTFALDNDGRLSSVKAQHFLKDFSDTFKKTGTAQEKWIDLIRQFNTVGHASGETADGRFTYGYDFKKGAFLLSIRTSRPPAQSKAPASRGVPALPDRNRPPAADLGL